MTDRLEKIKDKILPGNPVIQLSLEEIRWVVYQLEKAIEVTEYYKNIEVTLHATHKMDGFGSSPPFFKTEIIAYPNKAREFLESLDK